MSHSWRMERFPSDSPEAIRLLRLPGKGSTRDDDVRTTPVVGVVASQIDANWMQRNNRSIPPRPSEAIRPLHLKQKRDIRTDDGRTTPVLGWRDIPKLEPASQIEDIKMLGRVEYTTQEGTHPRNSSKSDVPEVEVNSHDNSDAGCSRSLGFESYLPPRANDLGTYLEHPTGGFQSQFTYNLAIIRLLLWKNIWLMAIKRHYILTALQIGLPLIFTIIFAVHKASFSPTETDTNITFFPTLDETDLLKHLYNQTTCVKCEVAYAPKTESTDFIVAKLRNLYVQELQLHDEQTLKEWKGFGSELEIEAYWDSSLQNGSVRLAAAVLFHEGFNNSGHRYADNHNFSYTIRIPRLEDDLGLTSAVLYESTNENILDSYATTASALQVLLNKLLTDELTQDGYPPEKILLQAFPRLPAPVTNSKIFGRYFNNVFPALLSLGFIFIVPSVVGLIVREKNSGMRDLMKVHGLTYFTNWFGWLYHSMILLVITANLVLILLFIPFNSVVGGVIKRGSYSLWGATLLIYCTAAGSWCILISSFFYNPALAIGVGSFLWLSTCLLLPLMTSYNPVSMGWRLMLSSLFPNLALMFATELLLEFDETLEGASWSILFTPKHDTDSFAIGYVLIEMALTSIFYNLLAWYFETVIASKLGESKSWDFLLHSSFWRNMKTWSPSGDPVHGERGEVKIQNLRKVKGDKEILSCESIAFKEGQTTVIYGQDGSRKTTLLSILAGLVAPTRGTAFVDGIDVTKGIHSVRKRLGFCPQRNTLFRDLTVEEHLLFFGTLKGRKRGQATFDLYHLLTQLNLTKLKDTLSVHLTVGQKRKLNLAVAIIGHPKVKPLKDVLLLDEPTFGVDSESRDSIEIVLQSRNLERNIVIMTSGSREDCEYGRKVAVFHEENLVFQTPGTELDDVDDGCQPGPLCEDVSRGAAVSQDKLSGIPLIYQHFWALMWKRVLCAFREKWLLVVQVLLPICVAVIAIVLAQNFREGYPTTPLVSNTGFVAGMDMVTLYSAGNDTAEKWNGFISLRDYNAKVVENVTEKLIEVGEENPQEYLDHYAISAEFSPSHVKAMFSLVHPHAVSLAINLASNAILRKTSTRPQHINGSVNFLLPRWGPAELEAADPSPKFVKRVAVVVGAVLPMGLALLAASFVVLPTREGASKVKQLQLMTGLNCAVYWGTSFLFDFMMLTIISGLLVVSFRFTGTPESVTETFGEGVLLLLFLTYGSAAIFFSYLVSTMFSNAYLAFTTVAIIHIFSGTVGTTAVVALKTLGLTDVAFISSLFLRLFPAFTVSVGVEIISEISALNNRCLSIPSTILSSLCKPVNTFDLRYRSCCPRCQEDFPSATCFERQGYLQWDSNQWTEHAYIYGNGIGSEIAWILCLCAFYMLLLLMIEWQIFRRIRRAFPNLKTAFRAQPNQSQIERTGESAEGNPSGAAIRIKALSKSFGSVEVLSDVSFHVASNERLGLIGSNGAGKSTLFRIITGDELPSGGKVCIDSDCVEKDIWDFKGISKERLSKIGYCPEYGGLTDGLTGKEMLKLFARLGGRRWAEADRVAIHWIDLLGLHDHENILCAKYNKSVQRRLSVAIALIGNPTVVLLDEPTTGVDSKARRHIWNVVRDCGKSVIISTHDMKECEEVVTRVALMEKGRLVRTCPVGDLKSKCSGRVEASSDGYDTRV